MKKITQLLVLSIAVLLMIGTAQAVVIDDFTQDRNFQVGLGTSTYPAVLTDFRNDATNNHIIGGRCDITLNIYAGDGGGVNPYLNFFQGSEAYESLCWNDETEEFDLPCTVPAYPANVSYNSNDFSSGDWTLEYGKNADLNAFFICSAGSAIKIDFVGDMYIGPRPVPVTITLISKKGTPQQATASKTINLVNPPPGTPATASFYISDFPSIDFRDVDYINLKFDNVAKNAVDYSVTKIYTECATLIELSSFTAKGKKLTWVTETEIDNAGFYIWRADAENGEYVRLNDEIIPAKGSATEGAKYTFTDKTAKGKNTYFYKLEDIDVYGTSTFHGPVSATPRFLLGIFNK